MKKGTKGNYTPTAASYARALLEMANERQQQAAPIGDELRDLKSLVNDDSAVRLFLASPAIGTAERQGVLEHAFKGKVSPLMWNFLGVLNQKGRLGLIDQIADAYADLLDQQLGKVEVDVTVAQRLGDDQLDEVRRRVSEALKRDATVHQYVDDGIIGGMVLRVGDKLIDASVRYQLQAMRDRLLAARPR
jgi:F-type H+-transporting ATPase subunit delta